MATLLAEGTWPCIVLKATCGQDDKQNIIVRIDVKIDDGPSKGRTCTYEDRVDAKTAPYVARSCKAIGWSGHDITTRLAPDVEKWIADTGGRTTVDIKHIELKRGDKYNKWVEGGMRGPSPVWDKPNAIGRGPKALATPSKSAADDANEALRKALGDDGSAPPHDEPAGGDPIDPDSIPFITSTWTRINGGVL